MGSVRDAIIENEILLRDFVTHLAAKTNKDIMPKTHKLLDVKITPHDYGLAHLINIGVGRRLEKWEDVKVADYKRMVTDDVISFTVGELETFESVLKKFEKEVAKWLLKTT